MTAYEMRIRDWSSDVCASDLTLAYFNVQRSACGGGTVGTVTQNVAGTAVLAGTSGKTITDYTLFELASKPPGDFDAYYSGWDIRGNAPASGAVIHHPDGRSEEHTSELQSLMRISYAVFCLKKNKKQY